MKQSDAKNNAIDKALIILSTFTQNNMAKVQSVVDDKKGLIVHAEAVNDVNDLNQFARQIEHAKEVLQKPCEVACADAGYADTDELAKIDAKGIKVIVPSHQQASGDGKKPFSKQKFS